MEKTTVYATFWERFLSRLIDTLVYLMLIFIPLNSIVLSKSFDLLLDNISNFTLFILIIALIILPFETLMISKLGGTPGKLLIGLRIQKTSGKLLNPKETFIRLTLGRAVSGLFFGLGYFWIFKNEKRQGWHDLINDSVVVRKINYGWLIGLLILIVFAIINVAIVSGVIAGFAANFSFFSHLLG